MTSIIKFTPLSGGSGPSLDHVTAPHCYLLEMDGFNFLLDCGFDSKFESSYVKNELKKFVPKIDAVLISYPDTLHLGALPFAMGHLGLNCPVYATVPVYKMGQMFMYDAYQARKNVEEFDLFTLDEVDKAFDMMTQLKYNQTLPLKGKGAGISIVPLPAGHMIGGTIWKIMKDGEEDIIYAVDFNHKKEQHLNGWDFKKIQLPALLITDAYSMSQKTVHRRVRDEYLMTNILRTLRGDGNVLICVDTAGRVLELSHMIDHLWQNKDSGLLAYSVALLNNVSYNVIEFAKSQIEWMSEKLMKSFEGKRNNPFQFRHLKLCHNLNEVNKVPSPKVVLASMPDLESGFSRELFQNWSSNPKNCVIVTSRTGSSTLSHQLVKKKESSKKNSSSGSTNVELVVKKRVRLTGSELEEYRLKEQEKKMVSSDIASASALLGAEDASSSSSDEDTLMEVDGLKKTSNSNLLSAKKLKKRKTPLAKHDIIMRPENAVAKTQTGFFKSLKTKYPMFPFHEEKIRWDDYGEIIKPEEWMDTSTDTHTNANGNDEDPDAMLYGTNRNGNHEKLDSDSAASEIPTKCIETRQIFDVKCKVLFIDFEGRSDGDSVMKVINTLKPRRTIVVRGKEEGCQQLKDFCQQVFNKSGENPNNDQVAAFIARNGETIDATTESYIYQVRLPELLVSKLSFSKGKEGLLSWVDGKITHAQEEIPDLITEQQEDNQTTATKKPDLPSLVPVVMEETPTHPTVFVNELKLSDFKVVLLEHGIANEFIGGVLFCGSANKVALRRHDSGRVTIEGTVCEDYYKVRNLLYQQYAII